MLSQKKNSKIVTFRVSPEEYDALAASCVDSGARSISAFARAAVLEKLHMPSGRPINISGDLATLGKTLNELDASLREASNRIRRLLGNGESHGRGAEHH